MMKKFFFFVSFLACSLVASATVGDLFTVQGIQYEVTAEGSAPAAKVTANPSVGGNIVIPETVFSGTTTYTVTAIDASAFSANKALTHITLPTTLKTIGASAFFDCSNLQGALVIPNSVTSLGAGAFKGCSALESVSLPSSITTLGNEIFRYCTGLTSVTFDENFSYAIVLRMFDGCSSLQTVVIPDGVSKISDYAFANCKGLQSVTIGSNVTSIGNSAFYACDSLKTVTLRGNKITEIKSWAFGDCGNLLTLPLAEGLTTIGTDAFRDCVAATGELIIPTTVTSLGQEAFRGCSGFTSVRIPGNIATAGSKIFYSCTGLTTVVFDEDFSVDLSTEMFAYCSALQTVIIPDKVPSIGVNTFRGCTSLESVTIGRNVATIGTTAFYDCKKLQTVNMQNTCLNTISGQAFGNCSALTGITFPETLTTIGGEAFKNCTSLAHVSLSSNITSLGEGIFNSCTALQSVTFDEDFSIGIPKSMFYACTALQTVNIPDNVTSIGLYAFYKTNLSSVAVGSGVTSIGAEAFRDCANLKSVDLSRSTSLTTIGASAFSPCRSLTGEVIVPDNVTSIGEYAFRYSAIERITFGENLQTIGARAFQQCPNLTSITFGGKVQTIGEYAFYGCNALASPLTFPATLTSIGGQAFEYCRNIPSVTFADCAATIGAAAFNSCSNLTSLALGNGITQIADYAFNDCKKLTGELIIPNSVTSIGAKAFYNCAGITAIQLGSNVTALGEEAFRGIPNITTPVFNDHIFAYMPPVYQHNGAGQLYDYTIQEGTKIIASYAFDACNYLQRVIIPNSVHTIDNYAFRNCTELLEADIPVTVEKIGEGIFEGCSKMNKPFIVDGVLVFMPDSYLAAHCPDGVYTLPEDIHGIAGRAFNNCVHLKEIIIHNKLTEIGSDAFSGCTNLSKEVSNDVLFVFLPRHYQGEVVIKEGVKTIAPYAFDGCTGLTKITIPSTLETSLVNVFTGCTGLTSVVWNVPHHADFASASATPFYAIRTNITSFTFGDMVEHIPSYLCYGMSKLTELTFPQSLQSIGTEIINTGCTSLRSITWKPTNYPDFPAGSASPFYALRKQITAFGFGDAVEHIPAYLCPDMTKLTEITIPRSVKTIGTAAFIGAAALTKVNHTGDAASWCNIQFSGSSSNPLSYGKRLYFNNEEVTTLVIPETITTIQPWAFYNCTSIQTLVIGENVATVGTDALSGCSNLTSVVWNVKHCADFASGPAGLFYRMRTTITSFTFGEAVEHIPAYLCYQMENLTHLTIPQSVQTMGAQVFYGTGIKDITWHPKQFENLSTVSPFDDIASQITSFTFGDAVEIIPSNLCYNMTHLNTTVIPRSVQSVGERAFGACTGLQSIVYAGNMADWCNIAFENALSNPLNYATNWFINSNERVTELAIPASVSHISPYAFYNASGINAVRVESETALPTVGTDAFTKSITDRATLYVTCEMQDAVKATAPWSSFKKIDSYLAYITVGVNNPSYGKVTVTQPNCDGDAGVITALPNEGYHFIEWSDGNIDNPRTMNPTEDITLTAIFNPLITLPTGDGNLSDFTGGNNDEDLTDCDIVVADGATLTCDVTTTVKNITIQAGGKLVVADGKTLTITEVLTAQSTDDEQPQILTEGTGAIAYGDFQFVKHIPADRYYFFSLPFESETSSVTIDNGAGGQKSAVYNSDWNYLYYDGAAFAQNPSNESYWMDAPEGTITANQGYAVGVDAATADTYRDLVFQASSTVDFSLNQARSIAVAENPLRNDYVHPDKETFKGWNFIMNPYTSNYSTAEGTFTDEMGTAVTYVTIPDPGQSQTYTQKRFDAITLPPFFGFYVQVDKAGEIVFTPNGATKAGAPSATRTVEAAPRYIDINLSNGEQEDETSLVVGEQFTSAYEIGSDLQKMIGYGNKPQVYTYNGTTKYAFQSMNEAAAMQVQPMGVYLPATGTYTFSLKNEESTATAVYLYDYEVNTVTNLVETDYTFTSGRLNSEKRFAISAVFAPSQTTALPTTDDATAAFMVHQDGDLHITLHGVAAGDGIRIINVHGQVITQWTATDTTTEADLPQSGLYMVERTSATGIQVNKIILQ